MKEWNKNLCSPTVVKELLAKYQLAPQKGFGQNFLINARIPEEIAESSVPHEAWNDSYGHPLCALEIGPGLGTMTRELARLYDQVAAVEIDRGLIPLLGETLADCENVRVFNQDFMKLDVPTFLREQFGEHPVHVCANLPYYITTPILMKLLEAQKPSVPPQIQSVTVLVQTEVADRLCAPAGSAAYGAITAAVRLAGTAEKLFNVSAGNFLPQPKVASSVVQVRLYPNGIRDALSGLPADDAALDSLIVCAKELISLGFAQRRKTLCNALSSVYARENVAAALEDMGLRVDIRGEKLSAEQFVTLAQRLLK
ncbi:ribosomal RNA small subunit methyltransferase A [Clostridiales bacterium]|nr:ribosomal RNA small subunit methyltransferase A [Clostridiales bacterium]GFI55801.1 ribosomal RNA small subunit methyltransferase A [Clostridiales bacterium]